MQFLRGMRKEKLKERLPWISNPHPHIFDWEIISCLCWSFANEPWNLLEPVWCDLTCRGPSQLEYFSFKLFHQQEVWFVAHSDIVQSISVTSAFRRRWSRLRAELSILWVPFHAGMLLAFFLLKKQTNTNKQTKTTKQNKTKQKNGRESFNS